MTTLASHRRGILAASVVTLAALGTAWTAGAATITWGAATDISGDGNVSTVGTLIGAINIGGPGVAGTTVNGVPFTGLGMTGYDLTSGPFRLTAANGMSYASGSGATTFPYLGLSSVYKVMLGSLGGGISGAMTLTMSGLVSGESYAFQWWMNDSANTIIFKTTATAGDSITLVGNNTGQLGGVGDFTIGTFTADQETQDIVFTTGGFGSSSLLNGFQLRKLSGVPEPGSAGLLLLGALGLGVRRLRRAC